MDTSTQQKIGRRSFGGKLDGFADKHERNFEKKHLRAYMKGHQRFCFGKDSLGHPMWFDVKEIWTA